MPQQTKSELNLIITKLEMRLDYYTKDQERHARELARVSRMFLQLYEEKSTIDLRYGWLEEAGQNVVNSCPEHLPQMVVALADELGIEITGD